MLYTCFYNMNELIRYYETINKQNKHLSDDQARVKTTDQQELYVPWFAIMLPTYILVQCASGNMNQHFQAWFKVKFKPIQFLARPRDVGGILKFQYLTTVYLLRKVS